MVMGALPPGEVGRSAGCGGFFLYYRIVRDFLWNNGRNTVLTVSSSGLPLHFAIASQKRTAARSTGSAGYCHARSSIRVEQSGVESGIS